MGLKLCLTPGRGFGYSVKACSVLLFCVSVHLRVLWRVCGGQELLLSLLRGSWGLHSGHQMRQQTLATAEPSCFSLR